MTALSFSRQWSCGSRAKKSRLSRRMGSVSTDKFTRASVFSFRFLHPDKRKNTTAAQTARKKGSGSGSARRWLDLVVPFSTPRVAAHGAYHSFAGQADLRISLREGTGRTKPVTLPWGRHVRLSRTLHYTSRRARMQGQKMRPRITGAAWQNQCF